MSRHRNVRSMNYEDEYYDEDEAYGHSFDDNYCISPGTAAQFTFNRDRGMELSTFMGHEEGIPEEDEEEAKEEVSPRDEHRGSLDYTRPQLSDIQEANLNSCLEEIRSILGESVPEHIMVDTVIKHNFSLETALNDLLLQQEAPKPQREPRGRRNRSQEFDELDLECDGPLNLSNDPDLECDSPFIHFDNPFVPSGFKSGLVKFGDIESGTISIDEEKQGLKIDKDVKNESSVGKNGKNKEHTAFAEKSGINKHLSEQEHSNTDVTTQDNTSKSSQPDLMEKIKLLSEHVSELSMNERAELPLSPNSNKENIPYQGKKGRVADLTKVQAQSDDIDTQKQSDYLTLRDLAGQDHSDKIVTTGLSLADLARMQDRKNLPSQPKATLDLKKGTQMEKQTLSLSDLAKGSTVHAKKLTGLSLNISDEKHGSVKSFHSSQSRKNESTDQHKLSGVSLANMGRNKEKLLEKSPNPSLAELAMEHQTVKQSSVSASTCGNNEKAENTKPSLAELIAKHEPKAWSSKSSLTLNDLNKTLAETSVKSSVSSQNKLSLEALNTENKDKQKISLSELVKTNEKQAEQKVESKALIKAEQKPSLNESANEFPSSKKSGLSLADLAVKQNKEESKQGKPNVSLADLAKTKDVKTRSKLLDKDNTDADKSLIGSIKKMAVSDKEISRGEKTKMDEQCQDVARESGVKGSRKEVLIENLDSLIQAQASKFATHASKLGKTLCLKVRVKHGDNSSVMLRKYKTKKFSYKAQMKGRERNSPVHVRKIIPYDFSEPSPDDIVKQRQKAAFSRTGERKISS